MSKCVKYNKAIILSILFGVYTIMSAYWVGRYTIYIPIYKLKTHGTIKKKCFFLQSANFQISYFQRYKFKKRYILHDGTFL